MSTSAISPISSVRLQDHAPDVHASFVAAQKAISASGLDHGLLELVKIRASQINGCTFCLEMHVAAARKMGMPDEKLHLVAAWDEAHGVFSDDECAALAWTEALTRLADHTVSDDLYENLQKRFDQKQIANLTAAVGLINAWNRIAKSLHYPLQGTLK